MSISGFFPSSSHLVFTLVSVHHEKWRYLNSLKNIIKEWQGSDYEKRLEQENWLKKIMRAHKYDKAKQI